MPIALIQTLSSELDLHYLGTARATVITLILLMRFSASPMITNLSVVGGGI